MLNNFFTAILYFQEGTGQKIGQLFAISSLSRAGLMKKVIKADFLQTNWFNSLPFSISSLQCSLDEATWLLEPIVPLLQQQDYRAISAYAISTIVSQVDLFFPFFDFSKR